MTEHLHSPSIDTDLQSVYINAQNDFGNRFQQLEFMLFELRRSLNHMKDNYETMNGVMEQLLCQPQSRESAIETE